MTLLRSLRKLFNREPEPAPKPEGDLRAEFQWFLDNGMTPECPDCGCNEWLAGPQGGIAQNIKCGAPRCGSQFNIAAVEGGLLSVDRI